MAITWKDSYVIDTVYPYVFWKAWSPAHMAMIAVLNKIAPPPLDKFRYLDLGCGHGAQLVILAAANPQGAFVGVDFNPEHIATGEKLKQELGLDNLSFICASFDELAESPPADFGKFDYMLAHGVYSWVSVTARISLRKVLQQAGAVGALTFLSYNTLPGMSAIAGLQHFMIVCAQRQEGSSDDSAKAAIDIARKIDALNIGSFFNQSSLKAQMQDNESSNYLSHEYLNEHWRAFYCDEVFADMATAGLEWVGHSEALANFPETLLGPEVSQHIPGPDDVAWRQKMLDFITDRNFRTDVFHIGAATLSDEEQMTRFRTMRFCTSQRALYWTKPVISALGLPLINREVMSSLQIPFLTGYPTGQEIEDVLATQESQITLPVALAILCALNDVMPVLPLEVDPAPSKRLNRFIADEHPFGARMRHFASPICGNGVLLSHIAVLALLTEGEITLDDKISKAMSILKERGGPLMIENRPVTSSITQKSEIARYLVEYKEYRRDWFDILNLYI
jgi:SAM-dependent methyltransferase